MVHRLNGEELMLNAELIESVEAVPDTLINLMTGNRLLIKESVEEVREKVLAYRRSINVPPFPASGEKKLKE